MRVKAQLKLLKEEDARNVFKNSYKYNAWLFTISIVRISTILHFHH